jgi:hypothetical protein
MGESADRSGRGDRDRELEGSDVADRVLFISWGANQTGREERGLEVFNDALAYYGRMQEQGRIERFDVVLLSPNGALGGYMELHGTADQLATIQEEEEYQRILIAAGLIVEDLRAVQGYTGADLGRQIQMYQEAIAHVPQTG